jgi:hypothetical protein
MGIKGNIYVKNSCRIQIRKKLFRIHNTGSNTKGFYQKYRRLPVHCNMTAVRPPPILLSLKFLQPKSTTGHRTHSDDLTQGFLSSLLLWQGPERQVFRQHTISYIYNDGRGDQKHLSFIITVFQRNF